MLDIEQQFSVNGYQLVSEKKIPQTLFQSHKENNHRDVGDHRESFSGRIVQKDNLPAVSPPGFPLFRNPSEKHECFSEGFLNKGTLAEKD